MQEVESELAKDQKGHVADLFGGPFQGMLAATASIEELRRIPDATVEQADLSHSLFAGFEKTQAPYKAALDIWVSQHFGNIQAKEYLTLAGSNLVDQIRSGGRGLSPEYQEAISQGGHIGKEKRFFHWDLEFPEAFVDLKGQGWKAKSEQGFDAVVGNPPYDELSEHAAGRPLPEKDFIKAQPVYADALGGRLNVFRPFVLRSISILVSGGHHSFIVPMGLMADKFTQPLRRRLLADGILRSVAAFPHKDDPKKRVFLEAKLSTCIYVIENKARVNEPLSVAFYPTNSFEDDSRSYKIHTSDIANIDPETFGIPNMSEQDMQRLTQIRKCQKITAWKNVAKCYLGELMLNAQNRHLTSPVDVGPKLLRGANINRYVFLPESKQGEPAHLKEAYFLREYVGDIRVNHHRDPRLGFQDSSPIDNWRRLIACIIPAEHYCVSTIRYFTKDAKYDLYAMLALFNSALLEWRFGLCSTNNHVNEYQVRMLPIPRFERIDTPNTSSIIAIDSQHWDGLLAMESAQFVSRWEDAVMEEIRKTSLGHNVWPNTIHDALSASGRELTRLRESRQDLIADFAEWLFTTFQIAPEKFTGRSHLKGGQADVDMQDWAWFKQLLLSNSRACGVDPSSKQTELQERFKRLTAQAQKWNAKFEALDKATDRVIWQLVGLNPDGSVPQS